MPKGNLTKSLYFSANQQYFIISYTDYGNSDKQQAYIYSPFFKFFLGFSKYNKVIHVVCQYFFIQKLSEYTVYHLLKYFQQVAQSKVCQFQFKQVFVCWKYCFLFVSFLNLYIVVFPDKIQFVEVLYILEFINYFSN